MILKTFDLKKITESSIFFLLYGKNEGLKSNCVNELLENFNGKVFYHDEKQIIDDKTSFYENILSGSLFDKNKIIIIKRATDKICNTIEDLIDRNITNVKIIIDSGVLDTKSKLRSLFEKKKNLICIPTYPDTNETLSRLTTTFFRENKISISQQNINLIVEKCNGDRGNLNNEINKIKSYMKNKKKNIISRNFKIN